MIDTLSKIGGLFALATLWHFVADWFPQSHKEAINKARNTDVRAWHCFKYTLTFLLPCIMMGIVGRGLKGAVLCIVLSNILFFSHYVIDSYVPVMLWAKYLRKHPTFTFSAHRDGVERALTDEEAFKEMASTPLGLILIITMDQLLHIAFLLPIVTLIALYGL